MIVYMKEKGEGLLESCFNGKPGMYLAVQMNNFLKSRQSVRILLEVILLLVWFGKMIVALR